jgi:hypothetical protein
MAPTPGRLKIHAGYREPLPRTASSHALLATLSLCLDPQTDHVVIDAQAKARARFPGRAHFVSFNFVNPLIWGVESSARVTEATLLSTAKEGVGAT